MSYDPYEEVIPVDNTVTGVQSCIDSPDSTSPTCEWTYTNPGGEKIKHSQGFCLNKDLEHDTEDSYRGEEILNRQSSQSDSFSTGHALRMGELFYHGYEISRFRKTYYIEVEFSEIWTSEHHKILISPQDPFYSKLHDPAYNSLNDIQMSAKLIQETADFRDAPDLGNYILYIPAAPEDHPYVQDYIHNMLLVPREEVSRDGAELDKVGVSFYAFRALMGSSPRVTEAGDGLHNQLRQKYELDFDKFGCVIDWDLGTYNCSNPDAELTYLVHAKRIFNESMDIEAYREQFLEISVPDISYSLLSLTYSGDFTPRIVEYESPATIVSATVDTFPSMSEPGVLNVTIRNVGGLIASYIVTVTQVNSNINVGSDEYPVLKANIIHAIPSQARTLYPSVSDYLTFDVHTAYNKATSNEFLVTLKSPTGRVYDTETVSFNTEMHPTAYSWELQQKNETTMEEASGE